MMQNMICLNKYGLWSIASGSSFEHFPDEHLVKIIDEMLCKITASTCFNSGWPDCRMRRYETCSGCSGADGRGDDLVDDFFDITSRLFKFCCTRFHRMLTQIVASPMWGFWHSQSRYWYLASSRSLGLDPFTAIGNASRRYAPFVPSSAKNECDLNDKDLALNQEPL